MQTRKSFLPFLSFCLSVCRSVSLFLSLSVCPPACFSIFLSFFLPCLIPFLYLMECSHSEVLVDSSWVAQSGLRCTAIPRLSLGSAALTLRHCTRQKALFVEISVKERLTCYIWEYQKIMRHTKPSETCLGREVFHFLFTRDNKRLNYFMTH